MHNLITLTNYRTRIALYNAGNAAATAPLADEVRQQFERPAEQLLRYLLFSNEAQQPEHDAKAAIASSAFARQFAARGPRDSHGRSLRDFDLQSRLFRFPCSYLIYSDAFDALPEPAKSYVYTRLLEVLSGKDQGPDFDALSATDRRAILEILLETNLACRRSGADYAHANHLRLAVKADQKR